jgi:hypothetical protein
VSWDAVREVERQSGQDDDHDDDQRDVRPDSSARIPPLYLRSVSGSEIQSGRLDMKRRINAG